MINKPFDLRCMEALVDEPEKLARYSALDLVREAGAQGTELMVSIYQTHHMPEIFNEPERFNPDRWLTIDPSPFEANLRQAEANVSKDIALKKQAEANLASEIAKANWGAVQVKRYGTLVEQSLPT